MHIVPATYNLPRLHSHLSLLSSPMLPSHLTGDSFPEMSPGSSCSFTSGTPSSDHRFPDFIVEKSGSGSYYGCSEDDDSSLDRPIRTNSVGSKPEQYRSRKNRWVKLVLQTVCGLQLPRCWSSNDNEMCACVLCSAGLYFCMQCLKHADLCTVSVLSLRIWIAATGFQDFFAVWFYFII